MANLPFQRGNSMIGLLFLASQGYKPLSPFGCPQGMQMDIGGKKILVNDPIELVMDSLPSFGTIGKPKVSQTGKTGMMKFMTAKG
jgi:hypothetical protein